MNCLGNKQARRQKPIKVIISVPQQVQQVGGLESDACKEVKDDFEGADDLLDKMNIDSLEEKSKEGDAKEDEKSVED